MPIGISNLAPHGKSTLKEKGSVIDMRPTHTHRITTSFAFMPVLALKILIDFS